MNKILVANRGEIALRIMKSIRKMGLISVAIYSEVDRTSPHVRFADEAYCIGPGPSSESYLRMDAIIDLCKEHHVDGLHPGYGFLSENAVFAKKLNEAGINFIGPSTKAIEIMGSKLAAKAAVKSYDIPMVPGIDEAITDVEKAKQVAKDIGFPILIKASAGGGGKGMRIVENAEEFVSQMDRAVSEAESSFGDGAVFLEKYVSSPRHIEIQVLADKHGNYIHLFERECSIQRRHQKLIEEAPSSVLTSDLRERMGQAAIDVARSCDYVGAGTVEFLLENNKDFYFLEMNTRLQVEHPVTELITGVDLVEEQIKIAQGEVLSIKQDDLTISGHALELRVYAEDAGNDFMPCIGTLERYRIPTGDGIRVDDGFTEGMEIPIFYDSMISKLIVHGETRKIAIQKLKNAIGHYEIEGIETTLPFGSFVMDHDAFNSGNFDTHFVKKYYQPDQLGHKDHEKAAAIIGKYVFEKLQAKLRVPE